jgi:hypothetical protein
MDDELLKLECLRLVLDQEPKHLDPLRRAQEIFDWTKGRGQTDIIGGGQAKVVGKDGDLGKFTDYVKD